MKTEKELSMLRAELEELRKKLAELSEEELSSVTGGYHWGENWGEQGYFTGFAGDSKELR